MASSLAIRPRCARVGIRIYPALRVARAARTAWATIWAASSRTGTLLRWDRHTRRHCMNKRTVRSTSPGRSIHGKCPAKGDHPALRARGPQLRDRGTQPLEP